MKGLLIKDIKLMKIQKKFFAVIIAMSIVIALLMDNISFFVSYMIFSISFFSLTTISYDEFDNGNAFLFSLPVSRREYVIEKYFFSIVLCIASTLTGILLSLLFGIFKNMQDSITAVMSAPAVFAIVVIFLCIMIPLQIKFGAEKGRIAILLVAGIIAGIVFAAVQVLKMLDIDALVFAENILKNSLFEVVIFAIIAVIISVLISIRISISIMNKKQF